MRYLDSKCAFEERTWLAERGFAVVFFVFILVTILAIAGFVIDIGYCKLRQRQLQFASDVASLAATNLLMRGITDSTALTTGARLISDGNGGLGTFTLACGTWDSATRSFTQNNNCAVAGTNAVKVVARKVLNTSFAAVLRVSSMNISAVSVAQTNGTLNCIRPFGIDIPSISGVSVGSTFSVGNGAPGNWGKLDIDGNMSSSRNFYEAMVENTCSEQVAVGQSIELATGGASITRGFNDSIAAGTSSNMTVALTSVFGHGNQPVTIQEFLRIEFISQTGSGSNWSGTFRLLERNAPPPTTSGGGSVAAQIVL